MSAQAAVARALCSAFADAGVRHVVVSPGSRSTPFVLAAHAEARLTLHDLVDERVASFVALGVARASGLPALMITTSGSAPAHALPAMLEAERARLPLIVLSADRPARLHACGANQTLDQHDLFGRHLRCALNVPETPTELAPHALQGAMRVAARIAVQLVAKSLAPVAGPVHLNAPAHKALEPPLDAELPTPRAAPRFFSGRVAPSEAAVEALASELSKARRGLLIAGPAPQPTPALAAQVRDVCRAFGLVLAVESCSGLRFAPELADLPRLDHADAFYRRPAARRDHAPDVVLGLHAPPVSRGLGELLALGGGRHLAIEQGEPPDPTSSLDVWVDADPSLTLEALLRMESSAPDPDPAFQRACVSYDEAWTRGAIRLLDQAGDALTPQAVLREVARSADGLWLGLGNGLTVRRADDWIPIDAKLARVLHQRGLSGIDGLLSGAAGAALVADAPICFVLGDVAFRHDVAGLAAAAQVRTPLVLLVLDDDGGRIFDQLPLGARADLADAMPHFRTPGPSEAGLAAAHFGLPFFAPTSRADLREALATAYAHQGASVILARVDAEIAARLDRAAREPRA